MGAGLRRDFSKWSEKLVFEQFGGFIIWIFFQVPQFDFRFQSFLSISEFAYVTVHMCSNCAYLPMLDLIKGQLTLFMTATICCHKILVNFIFCPFF